MQSNARVCLAVDPGFGRLGLAVITYAGQRITLLHSQCLETPASLSFTKRLAMAAEQFEILLQKFSPHHVAFESLFFSKNKTTALQVAELRGVLMYLCEKYKVPTHEYNPNQIKVAVTGYGKSGKTEIATMVKRLIGPALSERKKILDDEMDAIAIALTHAACFPQHAARSTLLQK